MQEYNIINQRKYKRLPIELQLEVDEVFKQDYEVINNLNATIFVFDISKNGIGFISEESLSLNYYFRGRINLGEDDFFYVVLHIIREQIVDKKRIYGAEFVGLAPFLANKVDQYEKKINIQK